MNTATDTSGTTSLTVHATNNGELAGFNFKDVNNNASKLVYDIASNNISLAGAKATETNEATTSLVSATLNNGTTTLGDGASITVVGNSTAIIDSINVAENTTTTPYLYADPSYVAVKALENNTLDLGVYVGLGSVIDLGGSSLSVDTNIEEELITLFDAMHFASKVDLATGGFVPADTAQTMLYLSLGNTLTIRGLENSLADGYSSGEMRIATYNEDGSVKTEYDGVVQVADNGNMNNLFAQNPHNIALWFKPMYGHENVDGLKTGQFTADFKTDMYGMAIGIDKTFESVGSDSIIGSVDAYRLGFSMHIGSGDTRSNGGDFAGIDNDFDYYGLAVYGSAKMGNFTLGADISYTRNDSEFKQDLSSFGMVGTKGDTKSDVWNFALSGEYQFAFENGVNLAPYADLQVLTMKTSDYNVKENGGLGETIYVVENERQTVVSVPLGVKVRKDFELENNWHVAPELKIGGIFALGDLSEESTSRMPGFESVANMEMDVVDKATLDVGLGVSVAKDNLRFALDYHLQVSQNRTAHGVMGIIEYKF